MVSNANHFPDCDQGLKGYKEYKFQQVGDYLIVTTLQNTRN
jgi:hypothetical protein